MKKILVVAMVLSLVACGNKQTQNDDTAGQTDTVSQMVGNDSDEHGCKASAGETWSELLQTCVQLFDTGKRLNPIETPKDEAVISAFVLFDTECSKAEVFIPGEEGSAILPLVGNDVYQDDILRYNNKEGVLYINDKPVYKAE